MTGGAMDRPERPTDTELAFLYVDGGLEPEQRAAFERRLESAAPLQDAVRRAREVIDRLRALRRMAADLPPLEKVLERVDAEPSPALRAMLAMLERRGAPAELRPRVLAEVRAAGAAARAAAPAASLAGRAVPRAAHLRRVLLAPLCAAAALLLVATQLGDWLPRKARPADRHPRLAGIRFEFAIDRQLPGRAAERVVRLPLPTDSPGGHGPGGGR